MQQSAYWRSFYNIIAEIQETLNSQSEKSLRLRVLDEFT